MRKEEGLRKLRIPITYSPLKYNYSYLFVDDATIIDTGESSDIARSYLEKQLRTYGIKISDVERIILTHLHGDHSGLVNYIKSASGAKVYAHERAIESMKRWVSEQNRGYAAILEEIKFLGGKEIINQLNDFQGSIKKREMIDLDEKLIERDSIKLKNGSLRVIWTPGHAQEHICLYDDHRKYLFSGDHVLPRITPHIGLRTSDNINPLGDYLDSFDKLRDIPCKLVLPGHEYDFKDLAKRLEEIENHHRSRLKEINNALSGADKTIFQISSEISWRTGPWSTMSFWAKRMALAETYAHLVYLEKKCEVQSTIREGVFHFKKI